jgi:ferrochelatase
MDPYDAILIVSFGGPEGMDDVKPSGKRLRGRNVPHERMLQVARHYELFGGLAINGQNRKLIAALQKELEANGPRMPIYWGNRNWQPMLANTMRKWPTMELRAPSPSSPRHTVLIQVAGNISKTSLARAAVGPKRRGSTSFAFYNHPGFIAANVEHVRTALSHIPEARRTNAEIIFGTQHSFFNGRELSFEAQLEEASRLVAGNVGSRKWRLVSRAAAVRQHSPGSVPTFVII